MTKHIDKSVYLREAVDCAARVWFLTGAKPGKFWTHIDHKWVEITIKYNGEHAEPRRRAEDKESDHLAPETDAKQRLEDLISDRSIDA